jgi:hypothetical protein
VVAVEADAAAVGEAEEAAEALPAPTLPNLLPLAEDAEALAEGEQRISKILASRPPMSASAISRPHTRLLLRL